MNEYRTVLVAEDEPNDAFLIGRALHDVGVMNPVQAVADGEEAIRYLAGEGKYSDRSAHPLPGLLLLDLRMPRADGFDVLQWLKQNPVVRQELIVVVTSSSLSAEDMEVAYAFRIDLFLEKTVSYLDLQHRMRLLKKRWLDRDCLREQSVGT
jgi:CheY-like chemotaxis protein